MFGLGKKKPPSAMDAIIRTLYGDRPPAKSAKLAEAGRIAYEELLCKKVDFSKVQCVTDELFRSPIPYSTHDLAVSAALNFFKRPELKDELYDVQFGARLWVVESLKEGKLVSPIAQAFEDSLYNICKESPRSADGSGTASRQPETVSQITSAPAAVETYKTLAEAISNAKVRQLLQDHHEDLLAKFEALQALLSEEHNRITHEVNLLVEAARKAKKRNPPETSQEGLIVMLETVQDYLVDEYYRIDNESELLAQARVKIAEECERQLELKARAEGILRRESGDHEVVDDIQVQRFNSLNPRCAITFHKLTNEMFGAGHSEQQFEIEEIRLALDNDFARCQAATKDPGALKSIENLLLQIAEGLRSFAMERGQTENLDTAGGTAALGFIRKIVFGLGPGLSSGGSDEARVYALHMIGSLAEMFEAEPPKTFLRGAGIMFGYFLTEHLDEFSMPTHVEKMVPQVKAAFDQYVRIKDLLETTLWQLVEGLCEGKISRIKSIVYQELEDRIDEICEENTEEIKKLSVELMAIAESVPWEGSENAPTSKQSLEEWKAFDSAIKKWKEEVFRRLSH